MEGIRATGPNTDINVSVLRKAREVEERQVLSVIDEAQKQQKQVEEQRKPSQLAAESTKVGLGINIVA